MKTPKERDKETMWIGVTIVVICVMVGCLMIIFVPVDAPICKPHEDQRASCQKCGTRYSLTKVDENGV